MQGGMIFVTVQQGFSNSSVTNVQGEESSKSDLVHKNASAVFKNNIRTKYIVIGSEKMLYCLFL